MDNHLLEISSFGSLLRALRKRAGLTQRELGIQVGYSESQISRLEQGHRLPALSAVQGRFISALQLEDVPLLRNHFIRLAQSLQDQDSSPPAAILDAMGTLESAPTTPAQVVLRESALRRLEELINERRAVLVSGFAGSGKTTLGAMLAQRMQHTHRVFWHTVAQHDSATLFSFLRQLALFLSVEGISDAAPLLRLDNPQDPRAIRWLVRAISQAPTLLCVDEFHLLRDSPAALAYFAQLARSGCCWLLLLSRHALEIEGVATFGLQGLEIAEARQLCEAAGVALAPPTFEALYQVAQGNPLLLRFALDILRQQHHAPSDLLRALATQREISAFLTHHILSDLSQLEADVLSLAAILRTPMSFLDSHLSAALHEHGWRGDLEHVALALQERRLLDNPAYVQLHPLLKEHLAAFLHAKPQKLAQLHRIAATWLMAHPHWLLEALYHLSRIPDIAAFTALMEEKLSHIDATAQHASAVALVDHLLDQPDRVTEGLRWKLHHLRGQLLLETVRVAEAEADLRQALALAAQESATPAERAQVAIALISVLLRRGKVPEAEALCDETVALLEPEQNMLRGRLLANEAMLRLVQTRLDEAERCAAQCIQLAQTLPQLRISNQLRAAALSVQGIVARIRHDVPSALTLLRQAEDAALLARDIRLAFRCKTNVAAIYFDEGELDEALRLYEGSLYAVQGIGDLINLSRILNALGTIWYYKADLQKALSFLQRSREIKQLLGDIQGEATTDNQRAQVLMTQGMIDEARAIVERLLRQTQETGEMRWRGFYLETLGMVLLAAQQFVLAQEKLTEALALPGVAQDPRLVCALRSHLALAQLGEGDIALAEQTLAATQMPHGALVSEADFLLSAALVRSARDCPAAIAELEQIAHKCAQRGLKLNEQSAQRAYHALRSSKPLAQAIAALFTTAL